MNKAEPVKDWITLNFNISLTSRQTTFSTIRSNNFEIGGNLLCNRLCILNGKIELSELNKPI